MLDIPLAKIYTMMVGFYRFPNTGAMRFVKEMEE